MYIYVYICGTDLAQRKFNNKIMDVIAEMISREGVHLQKGDLVNYYNHFADKTQGKMCVVDFDNCGHISLFYEKNWRHRIRYSDSDYIEYIGNVKTHDHLITDDIKWMRSVN